MPEGPPELGRLKPDDIAAIGMGLDFREALRRVVRDGPKSGSMYGLSVRIANMVPKDEIWFVDHDGNIKGRITGIKA